MSNNAPSGNSLTHKLAKLRTAAEAIERLAADYHSARQPVRETLQAVADVPLEDRGRWAEAVSAWLAGCRKTAWRTFRRASNLSNGGTVSSTVASRGTHSRGRRSVPRWPPRLRTAPRHPGSSPPSTNTHSSPPRPRRRKSAQCCPGSCTFTPNALPPDSPEATGDSRRSRDRRRNPAGPSRTVRNAPFGRGRHRNSRLERMQLGHPVLPRRYPPYC